MAFILLKGILKTIEVRMGKFLWQGGTDSGVANVAWSDACRPLEEGGQGIRRLEPLNLALMSKHFWDILQCSSSSIWVTWILQHYLRNCSIWTVQHSRGSWSWRKILKLRTQLLSCVSYHVGSSDRFFVWHDPWHPLGPLIHRFPRGPSTIGIPLEDKLSEVIVDDGWYWPLITDIGHMEITELLPPLGNVDTITWNSTGRGFNTLDSYRLFQPPWPKVHWYVLLIGPFRIPHNCFILWLAILETLSTLDRAWWTGPDNTCVLCSRGEVETHNHMFFQCEYSRACLRVLKEKVRFQVPLIGWQHSIMWASRRWRGRHPWNASFLALLASVVYHIWMERNKRRFGNEFTNPDRMAKLCLEQIRLLLLGADLRLNPLFTTQPLFGESPPSSPPDYSKYFFMASSIPTDLPKAPPKQPRKKYTPEEKQKAPQTSTPPVSQQHVSDTLMATEQKPKTYPVTPEPFVTPSTESYKTPSEPEPPETT
ncbi:UNVERIFIED_CONTAM: hypothetical protein Slati_0888700 [Sesamum latifolium]|uniref:Reverse transcriptase zinc-binding domain-containing protein n=1 Tax=Sesamum latifolium TaxID=2727402 RepID=A0AAW2XPJ0_9LAMI